MRQNLYKNKILTSKKVRHGDILQTCAHPKSLVSVPQLHRTDGYFLPTLHYRILETKKKYYKDVNKLWRLKIKREECKKEIAFQRVSKSKFHALWNHRIGPISYDYMLITNLMHWLLFIHKIIFSSTCFEPQVLIFRRIQLYTCSIWYCHFLWEFLVAWPYTAWSENWLEGEDCWWVS